MVDVYVYIEYYTILYYTSVVLLLMSNTRNRNTQGNYQMEKAAHICWHGRQMYEHSAQGAAYNTYLAGNGLIQGKMRGNSTLFDNTLEIESDLLGLGSTLENPRETPVIPSVKYIPNVHLFASPTIYMPRPIEPAQNARPFNP